MAGQRIKIGRRRRVAGVGHIQSFACRAMTKLFFVSFLRTDNAAAIKVQILHGSAGRSLDDRLHMQRRRGQMRSS